MPKQSGAKQLQGALDKKNADGLHQPPVSDQKPELQEDTGRSHIKSPPPRGPPILQRNIEADLRQPPLSYPIAELPGETGVSRTQIYEEIRCGHLVTFKVGARRYARQEAVADWLLLLERLTAEVTGQ